MMQLDFFRQEEEQPEQKEIHELHCRKCDTMKPLDCFTPSAVAYETEPRPVASRSISGHGRWCRQCSSEYGKGKAIAVKLAGPRPTKPTPCECCGTITPPEKLHLDHDHKTDKFRGWICFRCNIAVGQVRDCSDIAYRLHEYLRSFDERT